MSLIDFCEERLGLQYEETDDWLGFDPKTQTVYAPDTAWFLHEVSHWLTSTPTQRTLSNYGLVKDQDEERERLACLLERLIHQNAETDFVSSLVEGSWYPARWDSPDKKERCRLREALHHLKDEFGATFWDSLVASVRDEHFQFTDRCKVVSVKSL